MLQVTKTYLPSKKRFLRYIDSIWENHILANSGPLATRLEEDLKTYTGCKQLLVCTNGTLVLQIALKALKISGEVITTPFSYVATTNAILWENCQPVFADIREDDFTIDVASIEKLITQKTKAILATHVYGHPCQVAAIAKIARKHKLLVIYDAAHAFGVTHKGKSLLSYGDIATCSFHATKLFHSAEGGAIVVNNKAYVESVSLMRSFGHIHDAYHCVGINARISELNAAMGLAVLPDMPQIISKRKAVSLQYDRQLKKNPYIRICDKRAAGYNYGYYPVVFDSAARLEQAMKLLAAKDIFPRRYFYPSLNTLPFLKKRTSCPVSESIAARVLCLPVSHYIKAGEIKSICTILNSIK